jgi:hypothetical protein
MSRTRSREHGKEAHEGQATMIERAGKFQVKPVQKWDRPFESTPAKQIKANIIARTTTPKPKKEFKGPVVDGNQLLLQQHPEEKKHSKHIHPSTNFVRKIEVVKGCTHSDEDLMKMTETIELILQTDTVIEDTKKTIDTNVTNLDDSEEEDDILPNPGFTPNVIDLTQLKQDLSLSDDDTSDEDYISYKIKQPAP